MKQNIYVQLMQMKVNVIVLLVFMKQNFYVQMKMNVVVSLFNLYIF